MSGILASYVGGAGELVINISNTIKPNIQTLLTSANWDGGARVKLVVNPSALVNTLNIPSLTFPSGIHLLIGAGALVGGELNGGHAITTSVPISIENYGAIKGGGGRGGQGGSASVNRNRETAGASGGRGGGSQGFESNTLTVGNWAYGTPGQEVQLGDGTSFGPGDVGWARAFGGQGGRGGAWREAGYAGYSGKVAGTYSSSNVQPGKPGQPAGKNVNGEQHVTWVVRGDA